jgi:hypothetical protein
MVQKVRRIQDYLRHTGKEVIIRFDPEDTIELPCDCLYDETLGKRVRILKKVEMRDNDGFWKPYPSISWYLGGGDIGQSYTIVLVRLVGEEAITPCSSKNWCPDSLLFKAAEEAGIHTETIEHD